MKMTIATEKIQDTLQEIWEEILNDTCDCYADEVGNRPCDYGVPCDACRAEWIQEILKNKLAEKGLI